MNTESLLARYARIADAPNAIARLRRFVLDLAVRGKLSEQQLQDDPAPHFPPVDVTTGSYSVPRSWQAATVGAALDFQYGKGLKASERLERGPIPVYGSNGVVGYTDQPLTTQPAIIVGRKGSAGALNLAEVPSWTTDVAYYVEAPPYFDIQFLMLALEALGLDRLGKGVKPGLSRSDAYQQIILVPPLAEQHLIVAKVDELMALCDKLEAARVRREATRDRLAAASLARLNAPNPDTFAADARFALDALPALTTRPDQIKQLRQTILNLAVRGKLVPHSPTDDPATKLLAGIIEERNELIGCGLIRRERDLTPVRHDQLPFTVPANWQWTKVGEAVLFTQYGTSQKAHQAEQGVPVLAMGNIQDGDVVIYGHEKKIRSSSDELPALFLKNMDLLYNRTNSAELVGKTGIYLGQDEALTFASYLIRLRPSLKWTNPTFLNLWMNTSEFRETQIVPHIRKQTGQANVNGTILKNMLVPLPPLAEQHRIVAQVDALMSLCDQLEASLATGETTRERLLDALLHEVLAPIAQAKTSNEHPRAAVSGYVVSRLSSKRSFGRTAHMKFLYLAESRLGLNLGGRYMREAAGPLDTGIYELEKQAEAAGWYTHSVEKLASGNEKVSYKPGNALDAITAQGITVLGTSRAEMDRLIYLMGGLKTEQVEIIATLFAAWNDALLDGRTPVDDWIVKEVREHWHVRKQRFTPPELMTWLGWMRQNDVIPLGHPPRTMQQTTMEL